MNAWSSVTRPCCSNLTSWMAALYFCRLICFSEVRKLSDWSPWLRVNGSRDVSHVVERFRCVCKASVSDPVRLRPPQIRTTMRYCAPGGDDCEIGEQFVSFGEAASEWAGASFKLSSIMNKQHQAHQSVGQSETLHPQLYLNRCRPA